MHNLACDRNAVCDASSDRDNDLRLDRFLGQRLLDNALHVDGQAPCCDNPPREGYADPAILADDLLRYCDAARAGRALTRVSGAEQAAPGGFPDRYDDAVANPDPG